MTWKIQVHDGDLSFSAGHFIVHENEYELLHGHNYSITFEVIGTNVNDDSYLIDFGIVKSTLRAIARELHHHVLLALQNPYTTLQHVDDEWDIRFADGTHYVLPAKGVIALEIDNITVERLAESLAYRILGDIQQRYALTHILSLTIGVSETSMQSAYFTIPIERAPERGDHADG